jgi:hypothetical protein
MDEFQVKDVPPDFSIVSHAHGLQDVESIQTAIEVIVQKEGTQRSLAQLCAVLEASSLTPSLVRPMIIVYATITHMQYTGSSGGHAAPDTVPMHPCRPGDKGSLRKGERQRDPARSARDLGTPEPRRRPRRRGGTKGKVREIISDFAAGTGRFLLHLLLR